MLKVAIDQATANGLTDLNKHCEYFVMHLLNLTFGYNLTNLNEEADNFPGLDLGDRKQQIAFQVTSTIRSDKVNETLSKCVDHGLYKVFKSINLFILGEKQGSYTISPKSDPYFSFDPGVNIIGFKELLRVVKKLKIEKLKSLQQFIESELPNVRIALQRPVYLWNVPHARNPFFLGREPVLESIQSALNKVKSLSICQAISGLGGIGKTQTAVEYAYRSKANYRAIFWAVADTEITLSSAYLEMAKILQLPGWDGQNQNLIIDAVKQWLETTDRWLLILDNADSPPILKRFLPLHNKGHILITSRARVFDFIGIAKTIELNELAPEDALHFLLERTGRDSSVAAETESARLLAAELGYLPLALEQSAAFILTNQSRFEHYLASYRHRKLELLQQGKPHTSNYSETVGTTWALNFEKIELANIQSANILRLSLFLAPDSIPIEIIRDAFFRFGNRDADTVDAEEKDPLFWDLLLQPITKYSLIKRDIDADTYTIHRLVQEAMKSTMTLDIQRCWALKVVRSLNTLFPSASYKTWPLCDRLLSHAVLAAALVEQFQFTAEQAGEFLNGVACYLRMRADFQESERLHLQSVAIRERDYGVDHAKVSECLNNLALVYTDQFIFDKAEPYFIRALKINETAYGSANPELALSYNNLGFFYCKWRKYEQGRLLVEKALQLETNNPEKEDFFIALILNNLAEMEAGLNNLDRALEYCQKGLTIREIIFNDEKTWRSYNTMGYIFFKRSETELARTFFLKGVAMATTVFGSQHPELITILTRYRNLLRVTGDKAESTQIETLLNEILVKYAIQPEVITDY